MSAGLVVITSRGKVIIKAIASCGGENSNKLAVLIRQLGQNDAQAVYDSAESVKFGCQKCLVVMDSEQRLFKGDGVLDPMYRDKFLDEHHPSPTETMQYASIDSPTPLKNHMFNEVSK